MGTEDAEAITPESSYSSVIDPISGLLNQDVYDTVVIPLMEQRLVEVVEASLSLAMPSPDDLAAINLRQDAARAELNQGILNAVHQGIPINLLAIDLQAVAELGQEITSDTLSFAHEAHMVAMSIPTKADQVAFFAEHKGADDHFPPRLFRQDHLQASLGLAAMQTHQWRAENDVVTAREEAREALAALLYQSHSTRKEH